MKFFCAMMSSESPYCDYHLTTGGSMNMTNQVEKPVDKVEEIKRYVVPQISKHDPVKVVQGSGGCDGYYYTSLYYYYYYYYY